MYDYLKTPASWILQTPRRPAVVSVTQVGFWALVRFEIPGWSKLSSGGCGLVQGSNSLSRGFDILAHAEGMECGVPRMHVGNCATAESCVTQHKNPTVQGAAEHAKELMPSVAAKTGEPRLMSVLLPIRSTHNTHVNSKSGDPSKLRHASTILLPPQPKLTSPPTTKEGVLRDLLGSIDGGAEAVATAPPQPKLASRPSTEVVPRDSGESSIDGGVEAEAVATFFFRDLLGSIDGGAEAVATAPPQPELASRPSTEVVPRDSGESSIDGGVEAEAVATAPPQPKLASRPSTEVVPRNPEESSIDGGAEAGAEATARAWELTPGSKLSFRVAACNEMGRGPFSIAAGLELRMPRKRDFELAKEMLKATDVKTFEKLLVELDALSERFDITAAEKDHEREIQNDIVRNRRNRSVLRELIADRSRVGERSGESRPRQTRFKELIDSQYNAARRAAAAEPGLMAQCGRYLCVSKALPPKPPAWSFKPLVHGREKCFVAQATPQLEDPWVFGHAAPSMSIRAKGRANSRHYASASDDTDTPGASSGSDESAASTGSPNADDGRVYGCPTSAALTPDLIRSGPDAAAWKRRSVASSFGLAAFFYFTYWFAQMYTPQPHRDFSGSAGHRPSITEAVVGTLFCAIAGAVAISDTGSNRDVHADLDSSRAARALLVRRGQHTEWGIREYILITLANLHE